MLKAWLGSGDLPLLGFMHIRVHSRFLICDSVTRSIFVFLSRGGDTERCGGGGGGWGGE